MVHSGTPVVAIPQESRVALPTLMTVSDSCQPLTIRIIMVRFRTKKALLKI